MSVDSSKGENKQRNRTSAKSKEKECVKLKILWKHIIRKLSERRNSVSWHIFENILMKNSLFNFIQCSYVSKNAFACFQPDKMLCNNIERQKWDGTSVSEQSSECEVKWKHIDAMHCGWFDLVVLYLYTKNIMNQRKWILSVEIFSVRSFAFFLLLFGVFVHFSHRISSRHHHSWHFTMCNTVILIVIVVNVLLLFLMRSYARSSCRLWFLQLPLPSAPLASRSSC